MKSIFTLLFLLVAVPSYAQHVCDAAPVAKTSKAGNITTQACWNQKDIDGVTVTATSFEVLIDDVVVKTVNNPQPVGTASSTGAFLYEFPLVPISGRGVHIIKHRVNTLDGSALSDGVNHTITNGPPMKPHGDRVK